MSSFFGEANNVRITNLQMESANRLSFQVSWDHCWNLENIAPPGNHDAVWIFLKYRGDDGIWHHADLSGDTADYIHESDLLVEAVKDRKGIFLKPSGNGISSIGNSRVVISLSGYLPKGNYDFKIFGIEMTWINMGSFWLGDGVSHTRFRRGDKNLPFYVSSENEIKTGSDSLSLNDTGKFIPPSPIPAEYPKGYNGFYCMKYEISQEQYVDFLNMLDYQGQANHTSISPDSPKGSSALGSTTVNRNGIIIYKPGIKGTSPAVYACNADADQNFNSTDDGENRACNYLNWNDVAAYLDWAALRPMTELEFEKTCRGSVYPVGHEYAWGTPNVTDANTPIKDGTEEEIVAENPPPGYGLANHGYAGLQGPLRNGFAAKDSTDRIQSGSGYYGNMEMSGNLWEIIIGVNAKALEFKALTGDGELSETGMANVASWPGSDADGTGVRGGAWNSGVASSEFRDLAISDRFYAGQPQTLRRNTTGGRGVR